MGHSGGIIIIAVIIIINIIICEALGGTAKGNLLVGTISREELSNTIF